MNGAGGGGRALGVGTGEEERRVENVGVVRRMSRFCGGYWDVGVVAVVVVVGSSVGWMDEWKYKRKKKKKHGKNTPVGLRLVRRRKVLELTFELDIPMDQPNAMHPPHSFTQLAPYPT